MVGFIRGAMLSCFKDYSGAAIEKISNFVSDKYVKTWVWVKTFQKRTMNILEKPQRL